MGGIDRVFFSLSPFAQPAFVSKLLPPNNTGGRFPMKNFPSFSSSWFFCSTMYLGILGVVWFFFPGVAKAMHSAETVVQRRMDFAVSRNRYHHHHHPLGYISIWILNNLYWLLHCSLIRTINYTTWGGERQMCEFRLISNYVRLSDEAEVESTKTHQTFKSTSSWESEKTKIKNKKKIVPRPCGQFSNSRRFARCPFFLSKHICCLRWWFTDDANPIVKGVRRTFRLKQNRNKICTRTTTDRCRKFRRKTTTKYYLTQQ